MVPCGVLFSSTHSIHLGIDIIVSVMGYVLAYHNITTKSGEAANRQGWTRTNENNDRFLI